MNSSSEEASITPASDDENAISPDSVTDEELVTENDTTDTTATVSEPEPDQEPEQEPDSETKPEPTQEPEDNVTTPLPPAANTARANDTVETDGVEEKREESVEAAEDEKAERIALIKSPEEGDEEDVREEVAVAAEDDEEEEAELKNTVTAADDEEADLEEIDEIEEEEDERATGPTSFREMLPRSTIMTLGKPEVEFDRGNVMGIQPPTNPELQKILDTLQESLTDTRYISAKIGSMDGETERLTTLINSISVNYELLAAEMEVISANSSGKKALSRMFLAGSLLLLATLVIFQIYMFVSLIGLQRDQTTTGTAVMTNITSLTKKLSEYDKNITKSIAQAPHQEEHPQPEQATAEKTAEQPPHGAPTTAAHGTPAAAAPHGAAAAPHGGAPGAHKGAETAVAPVTTAVTPVPVAEKLNRLRNGVAEKALYRKETGDWFIYSKKSEEVIADVEIIEALNAAYRKIGRALTTKVPLPAHKALCILKPDGKGGTIIMMTKEFIP